MQKYIYCIFFSFVLIIHQSVQALSTSTAGIPLSADEGGRSKYYTGFCLGINYYFGDLKNNDLSHIAIFRRYGMQISMERELSNSLRIDAGFFTGNIFGEEHDALRNVNFRTSMIIPHAGLSYRITNLALGKNSHSRFCLWLSAGIEDIFFNPSGDLKDANGQTYYYWTEGTIRNLPQNALNSSQAQIITRDYKYETDYRNLNMDNAGKYPRSALSFYLGLASEYKLNDAFYLRAGAIYHFTQTDYLDNITANSPGSRQGNSANDKFLFVYAGIFYNLPIAKKTNPNVEKCGFLKTEPGHLMKHKQNKKSKR